MSKKRHIAGSILVLSIALCAAADPQETALLIYGTTVYPAEIVDWPQSKIESDYPELLQLPAIGDKLAFSANRGTNQVRGLSGVVVATNLLACVDGPEIRIQGGNRFDFLHALAMTDVLHQSPQNDSEDSRFWGEKPREYFPPGDYWTPTEKIQIFEQK